MLECHVHNGRDMKPHVFWGSETFLIVSMGHSLWYHWDQRKLVTITLKWKYPPLTPWLSGGYSVASLHTRCDYTGYLCTCHAQGTLSMHIIKKQRRNYKE